MFRLALAQPLERAMTICTAQPYTNALRQIKGTDRALLGSIRTQDSPQAIQAVIKASNAQEMAKEAFANALAKALGLTAPEQYVVDTKNFGGWERRFGQRYVYASALASKWDRYDPRRLQGVTLDSADPLLKWKEFPLAVLFDEWIANPDRTPQNLLFSGSGQFMLIDNEQGFPNFASPSEAHGVNYLASHFFHSSSTSNRMQQAFAAIGQARTIRIEALQFPALSTIDGCSEQIEQCRSFVQQRWPHLPDLLHARANVIAPDLFSTSIE